MLGAICGSARSMDRAAQSMESVDRAVRFMNFAYDMYNIVGTDIYGPIRNLY